ncbi:DUF6527 family protein [Humibacter sp.]|uniref:DUF6527 family protein n=1 Tax=Humibacter sp. TaxID=1940291 RepID=UPI003F7D0182
MRLADLHPYLEGTLDGGVVVLRCPLPGHSHRIRIPVRRDGSGVFGGVRFWQASGEFPDSLTIMPSVDASACRCWHGLITNGEVQ